MASLPQEVLHQIAGEVYATGDMGAILAMCLSSRLLRAAANPWLHQNVYLSMNKQHQITNFVSGLTPWTANYVRFLSVGPRARVTENLTSGTLEHLVRSLPRLRILSWRCSLPIGEPLLKILNSCQNVADVRIHYHIATALEKKPYPSALVMNWKLTHLDLLVQWDHRISGGNPNFQSCRRAILTAPNLVLLSIRIQYPNEVPVESLLLGHTSGALIFPFPSPMQFPRKIKVLTLNGHTVGLGSRHELEQRIQVSALRELTVIPGPGSSLPDFLTTLTRKDGLRLEVLNIDWHYHGTFTLVPFGWPQFFTNFLLDFKGLKKLAIKGKISVPLPFIASGIGWHGETLEVLTMHSPEYVRKLPFGKDSRPRITTRDIENLCDMCPYLRIVTLDLTFGKDLALQRSFQRFQSLEKLTIYSPLRGMNGYILEPRVTARYVYLLALEIRSPCLREVTLNVGVDTAPTSNRFNEDTKWENERRMVWHVGYLQDDDSDAGIQVWESLHQGDEADAEWWKSGDRH